MQKFNFHTHTYRCNHADMVPDSEFVEAHIRSGFERMAFTDHCPNRKRPDPPDFPRQHMLSEERSAYLDSIASLKEKYRDQIQIFSGFEVEYGPVWVDEIQDMRALSDVLVLGQHLTFDENGKVMPVHAPWHGKERKDFLNYAFLVKEGLESGFFDILAHPDLFAILGVPFNEAQEECSRIILDAAERTGIPIEINLAQLSRRVCDNRIMPVYYPSQDFWRIAAEYKVSVIYGLDAHRIHHVDRWQDIIKAAEERIGDSVLPQLHFIERLDFEDRKKSEKVYE